MIEQKNIEEEPSDKTEAVNFSPPSENSANLLAPKAPETDKKERKVSRFKVSVVTEPDQSKLNVPEKKDGVQTQAVAESCEKQLDFLNVINKTYENLEKVVSTTLSALPGEKIFFYFGCGLIILF